MSNQDYDKQVLTGVVDMHVHTGPEPFKKRKFTDLELAREVRKYGAKAVVIKAHAVDTASRASIIRELYPDVNMYGGIALNEQGGGLNAKLVECSLDLGGKIVWLPTLSSCHEYKMMGKTGGVRCVKDGKPVAALIDILKLICDYDVILATGHLSPEDQLCVVDKAKEIGAKKILINHPELRRIAMPLDMQKKLLSYDVIFEHTYGGTMLPESPEFRKHFDLSIESIRATGVEHHIISTDLGQPANVGWGEGYAEFIDYLLEHGFTDAEVKILTNINPSRLLGIGKDCNNPFKPFYGIH